MYVPRAENYPSFPNIKVIYDEMTKRFIRCDTECYALEVFLKFDEFVFKTIASFSVWFSWPM